MKTLILSLAVLGFAGAAQAEDEFGARFAAETPAALQPAPPADEVAPQDIEPAAGEEAAPVAVPLSDDIENKSEEDANEIETSL